MGKIKKWVKFTDFVLSIKEVIGKLEKLVKVHSTDLNVLRQQNHKLLDQIKYHEKIIEKLENKINKLEDYFVQYSLVHNKQIDTIQPKESIHSIKINRRVK